MIRAPLPQSGQRSLWDSVCIGSFFFGFGFLTGSFTGSIFGSCFFDAGLESAFFGSDFGAGLESGLVFAFGFDCTSASALGVDSGILYLCRWGQIRPKSKKLLPSRLTNGFTDELDSCGLGLGFTSFGAVGRCCLNLRS